jgi:hypothetical protein
MCSLLVIFLSKIMPRKFTLFTNRMSLPFIVKLTSLRYVSTDGQSASLSWYWPPFGADDKILNFFEWHLLSSSGGHPLWREDGSVICSAITHWLESCRTQNHILLSHLRLSSTWRARSPYLYPSGTGCPSYTPMHWVYLYSSPLPFF